MDTTTRLKARLGAATRFGQEDLAEELRADLAVATAANSIRRALAEAAPLTPDRVRALCEVIESYAATPATAGTSATAATDTELASA